MRRAQATRRGRALGPLPPWPGWGMLATGGRERFNRLNPGHPQNRRKEAHDELDVSLWNARRLAGHTVTVYVHGTKVGTMTVRRDGHAHLHRHRGSPAISAGQTIKIRTRSGTLVASGTFHRDR